MSRSPVDLSDDRLADQIDRADRYGSTEITRLRGALLAIVALTGNTGGRPYAALTQIDQLARDALA